MGLHLAAKALILWAAAIVRGEVTVRRVDLLCVSGLEREQELASTVSVASLTKIPSGRPFRVTWRWHPGLFGDLGVSKEGFSNSFCPPRSLLGERTTKGFRAMEERMQKLVIYFFLCLFLHVYPTEIDRTLRKQNIYYEKLFRIPREHRSN